MAGSFHRPEEMNEEEDENRFMEEVKSFYVKYFYLPRGMS